MPQSALRRAVAVALFVAGAAFTAGCERQPEGAVVVAVWFFAYDLARGRPFHTPGLLIGRQTRLRTSLSEIRFSRSRALRSGSPGPISEVLVGPRQDYRPQGQRADADLIGP